MIDRIRQAYRAEVDNLQSWLALASRPTNPHRRADLLTAAEYVGRVELLAAILRVEDNDTEADDEAETLAAEYDRVRGEVFA